MTAHELDHLAIATSDWNVQAEMLVRELGATFRMGGKVEDFTTAQFAVSDDMRFELMISAKPDSFVSRFLGEHDGTATPHHITFKVADIEASMAVMAAHGFDPILVNIGNDIWREFFIHPRQSQLGFLVQCVETPQGEVAPDPDSEYAVQNAWVPATRPPATVAGLYVEVASSEVPLRLLRDALGGVIRAQQPGRTVIEWPFGAPIVLTEVPGQQQARGVVGITTYESGQVDLDLLDAVDAMPRAPYRAELGIRVLNISQEN